MIEIFGFGGDGVESRLFTVLLEGVSNDLYDEPDEMLCFGLSSNIFALTNFLLVIVDGSDFAWECDDIFVSLVLMDDISLL